MSTWHTTLPLQELLYFADEHVALYCGDCARILPELPLDGGFGFSDPIYNVGKDYGVCKDRMSEDEYLAFTRSWMEPLKRCAANCIFTPNKWAFDYWAMLGRDYKPVVLTWAAAAAIRGNWIAMYSLLLTNAKPTRFGVPDWWSNTQRAGLGFLCKEQTYDHPGYTSEDITNRVLEYFAPAQATVIDPFAGSGTTLWCAKLRGRRAIGIEIDEKWCRVAQTRCAQTVLDLGGLGGGERADAENPEEGTEPLLREILRLAAEQAPTHIV